MHPFLSLVKHYPVIVTLSISLFLLFPYSLAKEEEVTSDKEEEEESTSYKEEEEEFTLDKEEEEEVKPDKEKEGEVKSDIEDEEEVTSVPNHVFIVSISSSGIIIVCIGILVVIVMVVASGLVVGVRFIIYIIKRREVNSMDYVKVTTQYR